MSAAIQVPIASALRRASLICPQPVAIACGRVLRARAHPERLDACLRAAEVLARYIAAVSLSSFAAREGGDGLNISTLEGNLSFGHFLSASQQVSNIEVPHPAGPYLSAGFKPKKGQAVGVTYAALESLLNLRNELGHQLQSLNATQSRVILEDRKPDALLVDALKGLEGLLMLPVFVFEDQQLLQRVIRVRRLLLMGESADPTPDEIEVEGGIEELGVPYVAISKTLLKLPPLLVWELVQQRANTRLLFLDKVSPQGCQYKTVEGDEITTPVARSLEVAAFCAGRKRPPEQILLRDGRNLAREWGEKRKFIEETGARGEGLIPWELFDRDTLHWFVGRLTPAVEGEPTEIVCDRLLDGRTAVSAHERRQLVLLFGTPNTVRQELRRDFIDLQAILDPAKRWDDRQLVETDNLFGALRQAITFLAKHMPSVGLTVDSLVKTEGAPDYIALLEALINQFIHQDYSDQTACARVILRRDETEFFNAGHSLVDVAKLDAVGGSQSRNPLVSRAIRLVGFAEIAGSGLRLLNNAWHGAHRPPPRVVSNRDANNFTLTLDWRPLPATHDEYRMRLGLSLTAAQAELLDASRNASGVTAVRYCESTGHSLSAVEADLQYLEGQRLIERVDGHYVVARHLREIL